MSRFVSLSGSYGANETKTVQMSPGHADTLSGLVWASAGGTLTISHSTNGTDWDYSEAAITVVANTGQKISFSVVAPFIRVVYTNGASPATVRCALRFSSAGYRG